MTSAGKALECRAMQQAGYQEGPQMFGAEDDLEGVKAALARFYDGLSEHDLEMLGESTAPGFYLLEHGEYWSLDYTRDRVGPRKPPGFARTNRFEFKRIEVFGDDAFAVWDLSATVTRDNAQKELSWLESGSFKKIGGLWKVHFLHSTRRGS